MAMLAKAGDPKCRVGHITSIVAFLEKTVFPLRYYFVLTTTQEGPKVPRTADIIDAPPTVTETVVLVSQSQFVPMQCHNILHTHLWIGVTLSAFYNTGKVLYSLVLLSINALCSTSCSVKLYELVVKLLTCVVDIIQIADAVCKAKYAT